MTFEEYMQNGGDREEKLVVIYKVAPEKLTPGYRGILDALTSGNKILQKSVEKAFPSLGMSLYEWNDGRIQADLKKAEADFV
jgi:hypothetical protein